MRTASQKLTARTAARRKPQQRRARQTVEAVLEAVIKILKREGSLAVTTNRIAEVAGVSIGSVYQYFPDKQAIFSALRDRHRQAIGRVIERTLVDHADAPPDRLVSALIEALIDEHAVDPELHELLSSGLPHGDGGRGLEFRLRAVLRLALAPKIEEAALERTLFVLTNMIESLAHGAVIRRPSRLSLAAAKAEAVRAVMAYLRA
jgi:AcrR family transcriptional regulator